MPRQYLEVRFLEWKRPYTYHNDGDPIGLGKFVDVTAPSGATLTGEVITVLDSAPSFPTKPIIGLSPNFPEG